MADKQVMLTEEGYNKLVEKLNYLKSVKRSLRSLRLSPKVMKNQEERGEPS